MNDARSVSDGGARLTQDLERLIRERNPHSSPVALRETADYLRQRFSSLGLTVASHQFEAWGHTHENLVATPPGLSDATEPPLILGAHYDTVAGSPGADDNASALAVLLDVARRIESRQLRRPIHFIAFCLEEENLMGSRAYIQHLAETQQQVRGAIILECVGYARNDEGSQRIPPGLPVTVPTIGNFLAIIGNQASASLATLVEQSMKPHLPVVPLLVPGNGEQLPDTRRSDHTSFWEHGFPAVMLTDTANFRNPHYHRPTDTLDTLNLDFLASVADAVTAATLTLSGCDEGS